MTTTLRAALSAVLLAGFYVVALGLIVGMGALTVWAFQSDAEAAAAKLGFFTAAVAVGLVVALWQVARARPATDRGPVLTPADAPELWETVRELAAAADTRAPDDIRLLPDVNAAVSEDTRLLGLVGGTRHLYLGVPLLQTLDVGQLRSVLAHELGHYSRSHTRLGPLTYRGKQAIIATLQQLSGNIVGWFLRQYARLFFVVSAAVNRRQELEADQLSVRIAGRATAQSALREIPVADAAWSFYLSSYLEDAWESGYAPTAQGFFGGFGHLVAARTTELAQMRDDAPPAEQSRWDSHPSIAARVAAMEAMPDVDVPRDTRPASSLIPGFDAVATDLAAAAVDVDGRTQLDWEELTATSLAASRQRTADVVYRAAARVAGQQRANLGTVLDVVAGGGRGRLEEDLGIVAEEGEGDPLADVMELLVSQAAVQAGVARWQHSWSGPATLAGRDGRPINLTPVVAAALRPDTIESARAHLAELGVDVTSTGQVADTATAHGGEVLGGLASVKVDGTKHDVLVLDLGMILVPTPKRDENGKARMFGLLQSGSVLQLASYHRFLAYEEIATAKITKRTPLHAELTLHDGRTLTLKETWTGESLAKDSSLRLLEHLLAYEPDTEAVRA
ncbi:M48 family metallopeptidase [Cellulomonas fengjieae]|uniref:M48 family metallopeptidase n=1 Tax=Cellulomonas fengjieae TaxID=2819978 RepID=UPI001AAFB172|nr:M48 family metallopeptidase [Cellulomonas fengjieae]MBO3100946.1 M48 family metalloprotease [Cellulomonas fengjieae]